MTGRLIGVVGPSGAGKDSLIAALCRARPGLRAIRRVITRPSDAASEPFEAVAPDEFEGRRANGDFVLSWRAHGLDYGLPRAGLRGIEAGQDVLANLSRSVLAEAALALPGRFVVLNVTARHGVLAERLAARGRETGADISARLDRADYRLPGLAAPVIEIDNNGALATSVDAALAALYPECSRTRTRT